VQDAAAGEFMSGIENGRRNALRLLRPTDLKRDYLPAEFRHISYEGI
jgi:hypothetical protein